MLSDALIDGRVGVKDIEPFRVFLFEGDGQRYSPSNRILWAVKAYADTLYEVARRNLSVPVLATWCNRLGSTAPKEQVDALKGEFDDALVTTPVLCGFP